MPNRNRNHPNPMDVVMDGVLHESGKGQAFAMARASYAYSRFHGLSVLSSIGGAIDVWKQYRNDQDAR